MATLASMVRDIFTVTDMVPTSASGAVQLPPEAIASIRQPAATNGRLQYNKREEVKMLGQETILKVINNPDDANRFNWNNADKDEWVQVLCAKAQFIDLAKTYNWFFVRDWVGKEYSRNWEKLICSHIQYADEVDLNTLDEESLANVLKRWSNLAGRVLVGKHGGKVSALVLNSEQSKVRYCKFDMFGSGDWRDFIIEIIEMPEEAISKCKWDKINGEDWALILSAKPQYSQYAKPYHWQKLNAEDWRKLLLVRCEYRKQFEQYASEETKKDYSRAGGH